MTIVLSMPCTIAEVEAVSAAGTRRGTRGGVQAGYNSGGRSPMSRSRSSSLPWRRSCPRPAAVAAAACGTSEKPPGGDGSTSTTGSSSSSTTLPAGSHLPSHGTDEVVLQVSTGGGFVPIEYNYTWSRSSHCTATAGSSCPARPRCSIQGLRFPICRRRSSPRRPSRPCWRRRRKPGLFQNGVDYGQPGSDGRRDDHLHRQRRRHHVHSRRSMRSALRTGAT